VNGVLLVQSGVLRLWISPIAVGIPRDAAVCPLRRGEVRWLGRRAVVLRLLAPDGGELEVALPAACASRAVGPFLTAALAGLPPAPRERGT
jgi:hypothetical protein